MLPEGNYLPQPVVVERDDTGLHAHLLEPKDGWDYPCCVDQDGVVSIDLHSPNEALARFDPGTLEYGIQRGSWNEGYAANGDWTFRQGDLRALERPDGSAMGWQAEQPMKVTMWPDYIVMEPVPRWHRLLKQGLASALGAASGTRGFLFRAKGWKDKLFPELLPGAFRLAPVRVNCEQEVRRLAAGTAGANVLVEPGSVSVGGVRLRRR